MARFLRSGFDTVAVPSEVIATARKVTGWAYDGADAVYNPATKLTKVTLHLAHRGGFLVPGQRYWRRGMARPLANFHSYVLHGRATVILYLN